MRIKGHRGRLTAEHLLLMRIPRRYWEASFERIAPGAREVIGNYLHRIDYMLDRGEGLLLYGENGLGKTSAAVYAAKEVRRTGASVLMATAAGLRDAMFEKADVMDGLPLIELARTVDFLLIDDLGKEQRGRFSEHFFENLLRERGSNRLTTWITTNHGSEGLKSLYKKTMMDVVKELMFPVEVKGINRREDEQDTLREMLGVG